MTPNEWFRPCGSLTHEGWETAVGWDGAADSRWRHTGLRVGELGCGELGCGELGCGGELTLPAGDVERVVVPLAGRFHVEHCGPAGRPTVTRLTGRAGVFAGRTDVLYLGAGSAATLTGVGRVAVAEAPTSTPKPAVYLRAEQVPVEIRGAGRATRQVHNFGVPGVLDADRLIVCEVITPAGNWSSYPAHKHDVSIPGHETRLEEIYYFEAAVAREFASAAPSFGQANAFGAFVTSSSPAGEIDTHVTVRTGDVALVPYGYHGPASAPPEYDLYYLNVMAGPDAERAWLISDHPEQTWVRQTWPTQAPDSRLPYQAAP
ncbi:MAG: 5-deoxy-glucuronate isomerase [Nocardioides sp.]